MPRGETVFTPIMSKIHVPSRIHIFLWLVANNKNLTRDNLARRRSLDDLACLFCTESETTHHLFFNCCVARVMWETIFEVMGVVIQPDFESMAKWWLKNKKCQCINICTLAMLWSLWNTQNVLCFQGGAIDWACQEPCGGTTCIDNASDASSTTLSRIICSIKVINLRGIK
jgi:hypothetical protein